MTPRHLPRSHAAVTRGLCRACLARPPWSACSPRTPYAAPASRPGWYTQGDFHPLRASSFELTNELDIDRVNVPVVIRRDQVPLADLHELAVTVVDPVAAARLPSRRPSG